MAKLSYPTIPNEVIVDIQVSGAFYKDLMALQISLAESVTLDQYKAILEKLKDKSSPESVFAHTVEVILALTYEIESKATAQGKFKIIEIDPDLT